MKKLFKLLVFLSLIGSFACQEDDSANEPLSPISLAGYPRQSGVELQINNKVFYPGVSSWAPVPVNQPDSYDLFISTDQGAEFQRAATVFTEGYRLSLENLIDGTPYYITARANKKGQLSVQSDTIMVVPASLKQITNGDWRFDEAERISLSPTTDSAAFITRRINSTLLNTSDLYIFPYFTNEPKRIERNVAECKWSPSGKLIAYAKRVDADNASAKDLQLSVYDIASDSIINLPVVSTSLSSLVFSPDSEWIYYVDNDANDTDLVWRIKADGTLREAVIGRQTPGLENSASFAVGKFTIHPNGSDLFFSGAQLSTSPIYKYSSVSGIAEVVFDDRWPSYVPTLSPDGQKLAFLSDRSGRREIWTYEVLKGSFQQVTGFEQRGWYDIDIQWVTDSEMAVGNLRIHL